ncbi:cytochrome b5-like heme/steroid binding domain-containing protein [Mucor mucedo]|uniref:cytochrome b5-like heme/steroid binding domain-containing protein n=1 Tax=Mucor mucedo TaxID=29922 RepID=UPI002220CD31|nr:cytochrome b5-like heme/steroid binding domain-containing protein [Mucor mucedo]KAI7879543.1 cytochrome b5-like heme/steroid binding domain-containing protein [Mucor mucedo]
MAQIFTHEQVSKHNTRDDLYMIIDDKVYDITNFVDEHPGGDEILIEEGAKDASGPFEDVGHSPDARQMLEKYLVGDLDPESKPVAVKSPDTIHVTNNATEGNPLRIIIPVLFFIGYMYWRFFLKQ